MTIPLLTPETVKNDPTRQEQEQRRRIRDLSTEEDRLVKSINSLRTEEKDETERIEKGMAEFRAEQKTVRDSLSKEVTSLERRREEAMKPIVVVQQEADERNQKSKDREEAVSAREIAQDTAEKNFKEYVVETKEKLHDKEQLLAERSDDLDDRENAVKAEEARSKESASGLADRWVKFHETVKLKDEELTNRESQVSAGERANVIRSQELDKLDIYYKEKDRELTDRQQTFESTVKEIRGY